MKKWTAISAAAWVFCATVSVAQEQVLEAKASFIFNGEHIKISRDAQDAARNAAAFSDRGGSCGAPCIVPMQVAAGVPTLGETEVLSYLMTDVAGNKGLLVDARMPHERARGFIPGSVNLPYATLNATSEFKGEIFKALGARVLDGSYNFADVQSLLIYDAGPTSDDAGRLVQNLLTAGYPIDKIKYYRGGMQVWAVLGFSIEGAGS